VSEKLDPFINYYQRELTYLRESGKQFAAKFPKIARRLEMGAGEVGDPQVERLIESFAYLSAKLQRQIDDLFPNVSTALLNVLYPHFTRPFPATMIAQMDVDPNSLAHNFHVPRHTSLAAYADEDTPCTFQTVYPIDLWPLKVSEVRVLASDTLPFHTRGIPTRHVLKLEISTLGDPLHTFDIKTLRFHINGMSNTRNAIYELLFTSESQIAGWDPNQKQEPGIKKDPLMFSAPQKVGFESEDVLQPIPEQSNPAYAFLYEYFHFPQKFLFFDIDHIDLGQANEKFAFYIPISDNLNAKRLALSPDNFLLGCAPAVNLFHKISEPILVNHKTTKYKLLADSRREKTTEIHSIKKVSLAQEGGKLKEMSPYFSYDHRAIEMKQKEFWYSERSHNTNPKIGGTDIHLSFIDLKFNPFLPANDVAYADVLCTNRNLANFIPQGAVFQPDIEIPAQVRAVEKPTPETLPPQDGDVQWRLISQLSLNHLGLMQDKNARTNVQEILRLYGSLTHNKTFPEIEFLQAVTSKTVTRRMLKEAWRGFVSGTAIEVHYDQEIMDEGGAVLFSTVLNQFFGLYAHLNSFIELSLKYNHQEKVTKSWQPRSGDQLLI